MPKYAVVSVGVLEKIERDLATDSDHARGELDASFARFERTQPHLADRIGEVLSRPLDETALALGYFLSISIWLSFERTFGARLGEVSEDVARATEDALALEEELRASRGDEPLELDDVVSIEQPGVLAFVHEHVDAALDVTARGAALAPLRGELRGHSDGEREDAVVEDRDVDVDDVHTVYRAILALTLSLSHAVAPADGSVRGAELLA